MKIIALWGGALFMIAASFFMTDVTNKGLGDAILSGGIVLLFIEYAELFNK